MTTIPAEHTDQTGQGGYAVTAPFPSGGPTDPRRKSPVLATLLSIMPGLGQVYVGYYQRGFIHAIVAAILITLLASGQLTSLIPLMGVFLGFFWLYNLIDAGRRATLYNMVLAGGEDIELPQDFKMPGIGGSIAGGLALLAIGLLFLLHTRFGMSLAWMEEWWPLALMGFGAYLLGKAIMEKRAEQPPSYEE